MPQARGSSAGVWAQFGGCVGRNLGCLSIPERPHTAPLSQAESSAPGKPIHPERRISSRRLHYRQAFPQKDILPRADGFHLGLAQGVQPAVALQSQSSSSLSEPGSVARHDPVSKLGLTLPIPLLPGRAVPRNMPTKSEAACQIRPQDWLPLFLSSTCALCPPPTSLQGCAQCKGSLWQV